MSLSLNMKSHELLDFIKHARRGVRETSERPLRMQVERRSRRTCSVGEKVSDSQRIEDEVEIEMMCVR